MIQECLIEGIKRERLMYKNKFQKIKIGNNWKFCVIAASVKFQIEINQTRKFSFKFFASSVKIFLIVNL